MIDYLQLMRVPSLSDNRTLEIAEISRSLKALAKEFAGAGGGAVAAEPLSGTARR
ncbi:Replicative DNA helicase [Klebsiella aerogenes]|nr:Replicative DNA helicase [Klebsiella aerogenes]